MDSASIDFVVPQRIATPVARLEPVYSDYLECDLAIDIDSPPRPTLSNGARVRCRSTGDTGRVCRSDASTGFMWVYLDKHADDYYRRIEHGPYVMRELEHECRGDRS